MAKYNIYKLRDDKYDKLVEKIASSGFAKVNEVQINNYEVVTYFTKTPRPTDIWWLEQFSQFFSEHALEKNKVFSGLLLIRNQATGSAYTIALGKTHFYIQEFIDFSFGLKIAERIGSPNGTKTKSSKHFAGQTSKSVTSFVGDSILNFSAGEATDYVKLKPSNKNLWGKAYIHFGTSVQFSSIDITPGDLDKLFRQIEEALSASPSFSLPRIIPIKDEAQVLVLDEKLAQAIRDNNSSVGIVDFELYGVDFVFAQETHARLDYNGLLSEPTPELSTDFLQSFADSNSLQLSDIIRELKVKFYVNETSKFTVSLINMLDYMGNDDTFLHRGKWYLFSQSFVDTLTTLIASVEIAQLGMGFSKTEHEKWKQANQDKAINYREKYVIDKILQSNPSLIEYDRSVDYKNLNGKKTNIEVSDIYDSRNEEIIVVKIGDAKDFGYAFDQAMRTLSLMSGNTYHLEDGSNIRISKLRLLLVTTNMNIPAHATDINSLSFYIKLSELMNQATEKQVQLILSFDKYENN
jgi:uncharacterized protein (TIGR04141 family)